MHPCGATGGRGWRQGPPRPQYAPSRVTRAPQTPLPMAAQSSSGDLRATTAATRSLDSRSQPGGVEPGWHGRGCHSSVPVPSHLPRPAMGTQGTPRPQPPSACRTGAKGQEPPASVPVLPKAPGKGSQGLNLSKNRPLTLQDRAPGPCKEGFREGLLGTGQVCSVQGGVDR